MAPLYKPPTKVTTREITLLGLVSQTDPDWARAKFREVEYEFTNRRFLANPYVRGPYNAFSNEYPVGQPYGPVDPLYPIYWVDNNGEQITWISPQDLNVQWNTEPI